MTTIRLANFDTNQLELELAQTRDANARVDILNELAERIHRQEPEKALAFLDMATDLAVANHYGSGFVMSQLQIIHVRHILGEVPSALACANNVLGQEQFPLDDQQLNRIRRKLAVLYADLGDFARALTNLHAALKYEMAKGTPNGQAQAHIKIGNIYSLSGDSARALPHYEASLEIFQTQEDAFFTGVVHNSFCVDYTKLGRYDLATHHGILARDIFTQIDDQFGIALSESSLGEVASARQEFAVAADHFARALFIFDAALKSSDAIEILETRLNLSRALKATGSLQAAQTEAEIVLQHAQLADLYPMARRAHELLAQIHDAADRPRDALSHLKQFVNLNEQIFNEQAQREIQNLKVLHETEQAQAELEQQRRLREQDRAHFERLSQIKDEFVHNVTHDIKNPLSIIETSIYMLKERFLSQEPAAQRILNTINRQLSKILSLVEEMLELAKLEAVPEIRREALPLEPWLTQIIEGVRPLAENKQITLALHMPTTELTLHGDRQRLSQALDNLLVNAIKYTQPAGQICLQARQVEKQLEIRIQDTGIGIPPEALPNVFDRFYRVQAHAEENEGSGLGLHVVKIAVEQHGGTINVTSEVDKGTTFTILLPLF